MSFGESHFAALFWERHQLPITPCLTGQLQLRVEMAECAAFVIKHHATSCSNSGQTYSFVGPVNDQVCQVKLPLQLVPVPISPCRYVYGDVHMDAWEVTWVTVAAGVKPELWIWVLTLFFKYLSYAPWALHGCGFPVGQIQPGLKLSQISLCSLLAEPLTSLLQQKTNNLGNSCSRQNWVDALLWSIYTCHHSASTTKVNAPKWEHLQLKLPCNPKLLLLCWVHPVMVLLNLCSAWLSLWVTWISNVCSNDHAFLLNLFPSFQIYWKHIWTYKLFNSSPSSSFNFWLGDYDRWLCHQPWQVCEDLQVPGGCLLLVSILPLRCPVPWQCQHFSESMAEVTQHRAGFQLPKVTQFSKCVPHPPSCGKCVCSGGGCCRGRGWVEDPSCTTFWYLQPVFHKCKKSLSVPALYICTLSFRTSTHFFL